MTTLFRYIRIYDDDGDRLTGVVNPMIQPYEVIKETKCGWWIYPEGRHNKKKYIPKSSGRKFAWPTRTEALKHAIIRTEQVLRWQKWHQKCAMSFLENLKREPMPIDNQ